MKEKTRSIIPDETVDAGDKGEDGPDRGLARHPSTDFDKPRTVEVLLSSCLPHDDTDLLGLRRPVISSRSRRPGTAEGDRPFESMQVRHERDMTSESRRVCDQRGRHGTQRLATIQRVVTEPPCSRESAGSAKGRPQEAK